ncbi:uncharacterized protein [Venturia canescens]|uniref:uncharacterized protein n=1 Tax=Venturia canescens TaxID=32260 RepID=UPI001C9C521C|nr:uncharacterized protein LOC122416801 [Venturia canescens]
MPRALGLSNEKSNRWHDRSSASIPDKKIQEVMAFLESFAVAVFLTASAAAGQRKGLVYPADRQNIFKNECFPSSESDASSDCGGIYVRNHENEGKCGECGDVYGLPRPRAHENGGAYGQGVVAATFQAGSNFVALVDMGSAHGSGFFDFALCPLNTTTELETEKCFGEHRLKLADGEDRLEVANSAQKFFGVELRLPRGLTCQHCVLRWQYTTNFYTLCPDGVFSRPECGPQDYIRSCSDIRIR